MTNSIQFQADTEEDHSIRIFELWRGWQQEHLLVQIEQRLQGEGSDVRESTRGNRASLLKRVALGLGVAAYVAALLSWLR